MGNCLLGCDILYELGAVTVDSDGIIRMGNAEVFTGFDFKSTLDLVTASEVLIGNQCEIFGPKNQAYFGWHFGKYGATYV